MGKRSDGRFERMKADLYRTWNPRAVAPLLPHLPRHTRFIEPCAGHADLIKHLERAGHQCVGAFDETPHENDWGNIAKADARELTIAGHYYLADMFITNPPWTRELLHAIILNLYWQKPTWLLYDADWAHTEQARPYMPLCKRIVSVGRLKWIEGTKHQGVDNAAWYLFDRPAGVTEFIGRG